MNDDEQALRERLTVLTRETSRSEIARRTGTSLMNVSRYLGGTRVPAAFCMALCREFGVNPAWLMAGQGPMRVADVAQDQSQTAGDLLKLVEALGAVSRMRLGSVASDRGLKMMRELDEALGSYERLRAKLNLRTSELLDHVLTQLEAALKQMDIARAGALLGSAVQLARLCDDEALDVRLLTAQAHHSFLARRLDASVAFMRKRFGLALAKGDLSTPESMEMGLRLALTLQDIGKGDESRRILEAIIALADEQSRSLPVWSVAMCAHAMHMVNDGQLVEGIAALTRHMPGCDARRIGNSQASLMRAQVLAGVLSPADACYAPGLDGPKWLHLSLLAAAAEDAHTLHKAARFLESPEGRVPREVSPVPHYAGLMARVLGKPVTALQSELQRAATSAEAHGMRSPLAAIIEATIWRLSGDRKRAREAHRRARTAMGQITPAVEMSAMHHRNALLLDAKGADRTAAKRFFEDWGSKGFRFIAGLKP
ncbi:MAG: helix-turn-helix transcriptional regulator [Planctomycetes bacterium]|nr:helix-turn-helix transcriptional regulator [Planctomycetota bacterium]